MKLPRYPIYIPSRGRSDSALTVKCLIADGVPFKIVVEPQEEKIYADKFGAARLVVLPQNNPGLVWVRNWIKDKSRQDGDERHWQIDDNIRSFARVYKGKRLYCAAGVALAVTEDFVDRYENVAIAGLNYVMFLPEKGRYPPFVRNSHVYSCTLVLNSVKNRFRGGMGGQNEDVDMCLQVLADGWCTVQMNAFLVQKIQTMLMPGGQSTAPGAYAHQDGRLAMTRRLVRRWPGVVSIGRRFKRPHHVVANAWRKFDTQLKLKPGIDLGALRLAGPNEYGMELNAANEVKSPILRELLSQWRHTHKNG